MPFAVFVDYIDPAAEVGGEPAAECTAAEGTTRRGNRATAEERSAVRRRERPLELLEIGVPHDDRVEVLRIHELERPEQAPRQLMVDGEVAGPHLRPLEVRGHRVDVERLLQGGRVRAGPRGPLRTRGIDRKSTRLNSSH